MITVLSKILTTVATNIFYAFFTEKLISRVVIELLRKLAARTTNTLDDSVIEEVSLNLKL